uniref:PRKCA-binding protein n=1 Tax=Panagrolaimus sp. PS1159 TaxID=55785 RepID=A0AC35G3D0_9BILA
MSALEGVRLIPDSTELQKDGNKVGVAIGGGAPTCNCIYVVQVFENSPCAADGKIGVGDEIVAVNGVNVRGSEKATVAELIRKSESPIRISFNRIQVDPERGKTLDILFKKIKHWVVESIEPKTADALGLSRAVLCNDMLQKLLERLDSNEKFYKQLHFKLLRLLRCHSATSSIHNEIGSLMGQIAVRELSPNCVNIFTQYADIQSSLHKENTQFLSNIEKLIDSIQSHVKNAIPDVRFSLSKYMNAKFEYLSYCLKIKELEDEEVEMAEYDEYPARMETGNYEYRVMLKCRETSRTKFIDMRNHVQIKIQMLDEKQVNDLPQQMRNIIGAMKDVSNNCRNVLRNAFDYEIEVDKTKIDNEIYGIMRHLGIDADKRPMLSNEDDTKVEASEKLSVEKEDEEKKKKKKALNINYWKDNRIRATWPPDEIGMDALDIEDHVEEEDKDDYATQNEKVINREIVEGTLVDLDFDEASAIAEPLWPINWSNEKDETDLSNELIPLEWLTQSTTETSETKQKGVEIEPEMLQQFRSAEAELLLVDL